jgi:hypothetical protein
VQRHIAALPFIALRLGLFIGGRDRVPRKMMWISFSADGIPLRRPGSEQEKQL